MAESADMILPLLREMRAEIKARFESSSSESGEQHTQTLERFARLDRRFDKMETQLGTFRQALSADSLMSKLLTAEFEERIEILERKVRELEGSK